jgi:3',5'-nucleoside bisphosphate phosphatase
VTAAFVDLHAHSTASDGLLPPEQVITYAHQLGLHAIALTDHDSVDGLPEAFATGTQLGIRVVPGCELSAYDENDEVHLLALHIADLAAIGPQLATFREQRMERAREMVARLNARRIALNFDDVLRIANGASVGRPHVARALIGAGYVADLREAFDRYLGFGRPAYVPKPRLTVADAVRIAHHAGALAVWAHPGRDGTRERVQRLAAVGLDGVEVLHPSHSPGDVERLTQLVGEFGLVPSGGSDWHGAVDGYRTLGNMHVPEAWLALQDARLAARAA